MAVQISSTVKYVRGSQVSAVKYFTTSRIVALEASPCGPAGNPLDTTINSRIDYDEGGVMPVSYYVTGVAATLSTAINA